MITTTQMTRRGDGRKSWSRRGLGLMALAFVAGVLGGWAAASGGQGAGQPAGGASGVGTRPPGAGQSLNEPVIDLEQAAARPRPGQVQPGGGGARAQRPTEPGAPAAPGPGGGGGESAPVVPAQARAGLAQVESLTGEFSRAQWRPVGTEGVWFELAPGQVFGETIEIRLSAGTSVGLRLSRGERVVFHRMTKAVLSRKSDGRMLVTLTRGRVVAGDLGRLGGMLVGTPDRQVVLERPGSVGYDAAEGVQNKQ